MDYVFYRCKYTFDAGDSTYLTALDGRWTATPDKGLASKFKTRRDAMAALVEVGGRWARLGKLVRVRVRMVPKKDRGGDKVVDLGHIL